MGPKSPWGKLLLLAEIIVLVLLLLVSGLSARGWLALRQRLPMAGVTIVDEPVMANTAPQQAWYSAWG